MKLNKLQRYTAYCIMLAEIEREVYLGFCGVASVAFGIDLDDDFRFSNFKKYFPELWRKRKRGEDECSVLLWDCKAARISALQAAIIETHP